jgi:YVTN family beta-propeller protein
MMATNSLGRFLCLALASVIGLAEGSLGAAASDATMMAYVTSSGGTDVTVVNLQTRKVAADIVLGQGVHGACGPADGRRVFLTVMSTRTLKIVDTATSRVVGSVPLVSHPFGARPNECASTPDGRYAAVPMRFYGRQQSALGDVDVIDMGQRRIVKVLPIPFPHNCVDAGSNQLLYCETRARGRIYRLNLETMSFDEQFTVGRDPRPFAIATRTGRIFSALGGFHGFVVVNMENREIQRIALPETGPEAPVCQRYEPNTPTHGIALTPDGRELWVTSMTNGSVYVYDVARRTFSKPIHTGDCPNWISVTPNGEYVTVSNSGEDTMSIIDAASEKVVADLKVGKVPKRLLAVDVPRSDRRHPSGRGRSGP